MTRESQYHMPYANYAQKDCKLISSIFHFFHPRQHRRRLKLPQPCPCSASFRHIFITCNTMCTLKSNMLVMDPQLECLFRFFSARSHVVLVFLGFHYASNVSNQIWITSNCTSVLL